MKLNPRAPKIFEFEDYRKFLGSLFAFEKKNSKSFSHRALALRAGFSSPNFFQLVIQGKRNLSLESARKISGAFKLNSSEAKYFEALIQFNQAKKLSQKSRAFEEMNKLRPFREFKKLASEEYDYYSSWENVAVRELVGIDNFKENIDWISARLKLSPKKVQESLELLQKLGLLSRSKSGELKQSESQISTGQEIRSVGVRNFHEEMMKKAVEAMDQVAPEHRDFSAATMKISASQLEDLKARVFRFRQSLIKSLEEAPVSKDQVYHLGIQIFPLTDVKAEKS